ncbi:MAG: hypothetical protein JOY81_06870, partial [Alphaproteobacteria bacterium]|nr:hypothetical protein [Alphaproteobacteria bacterium]
ETDDEQFELAHLFRLQEKFNSYLEFVESGQLNEQFPAAAGCKVIIRVRGLYALSTKAERFLEMAAGPLGEAGCELGFERFETAPEEG